MTSFLPSPAGDHSIIMMTMWDTRRKIQQGSDQAIVGDHQEFKVQFS